LTNRRLLEQHRWRSDHRHQHQGLGATLLRDALGRVTFASEQLAVRAVVVRRARRALLRALWFCSLLAVAA
jgi:hypothetical protein